MIFDNDAIAKIDGFQTDLFDHKEFAERIYSLTQITNMPSVIAIDGPWGSGKTVFLKNFKEKFQDKSVVVYFDAFNNDFTHEAFMPLASLLIEALKSNEENSEIVSDLISKSKRFAGMIARRGTKLAIRLATLGVIETADLEGAEKDIASALKDSAEELASDLFDSYQNDKKIREDFLHCLEQAALANKTQIIIIIDELDRCRPDFAAEILETAKHYFGVSRVNFILGVNLEQLKNSLRALYGTELDGHAYLRKFLTLTVSLPKRKSGRGDDDRMKFIDFLEKQLDIPENKKSLIRETFDEVARLAIAHDLPFREISKICEICALAALFTPERVLKINTIIGGLAAMKTLRMDLYENARNGNLKFADIEEFLAISDIDTEYSPELHVKKLWAELTEEVKIPSESGMSQFFFRHHLRPDQVIPFLCNSVVEAFLTYDQEID